jgi:hypothetical protein
MSNDEAVVAPEGLIGPFLPKLARRKDRRGRPWRENREVLNGILWILRPAPRGQTRRPAIRRIKPATGGFRGGSAPARCGPSSKSSRRRSTTKASLRRERQLKGWTRAKKEALIADNRAQLKQL